MYQCSDVGALVNNSKNIHLHPFLQFRGEGYRVVLTPIFLGGGGLRPDLG